MNDTLRTALEFRRLGKFRFRRSANDRFGHIGVSNRGLFCRHLGNGCQSRKSIALELQPGGELPERVGGNAASLDNRRRDGMLVFQNG